MNIAYFIVDRSFTLANCYKKTEGSQEAIELDLCRSNGAKVVTLVVGTYHLSLHRTIRAYYAAAKFTQLITGSMTLLVIDSDEPKIYCEPTMRSNYEKWHNYTDRRIITCCSRANACSVSRKGNRV